MYMIQCNRCHLQHIQENMRPSRNIDAVSTKPSTVAEHFLSHPIHSYTDMQLIPLEFIQSSLDSIITARVFLVDLAGTFGTPHDIMKPT